MGSSKKHKEKDKDREHRHKRRRRSRSRSRSKERQSRRKNREEKSRTRQECQSEEDIVQDIRPKTEISAAPEQPKSSRGDLSLSVEETNRLRIKLGLKPLDVGGSSENAGAEGDSEKPKPPEDVHAPAVNWGDQKKTEKLREKVQVLKEKRKIQGKLSKVKTLGESDSDEESMLFWVKKSRKIQKERDLAEKRAKMLEEMDAEFGIGSLVQEEFKDTRKDYSSKDLSGMRVEHNLNKFNEGKTVVLTLKDKGILDEDDEDVLVNVNIIDDEKAEKNVDNKKKKPEYKPYDEPEYDEYGMLKPNSILDKYDEDIDGNTKKKSFELGSGGKYDAQGDREMERIQAQLRLQGQTLSMPSLTIASEYFTPDEMNAKFKKVKKKVRKIRKKNILKADDLVPLPEQQALSGDYGSRSRGRGIGVEESENQEIKPEVKEEINQNDGAYSTEFAESLTFEIKQEPQDMDVDEPELEEPEILGPDEDLTGIPVDEEVENELHSALSKARKLKQRKDARAPEKVLQHIRTQESKAKSEPDIQEPEGIAGSTIVLNSTSEFCRNLGEIPTYGLSGNREEERDELMDTELELMEQQRRQQELEESASGWNEVDIDTKPVDIMGEEQSVLEEEPIVNEGVGAALALARKKGYLENDMKKKISAPKNNHIAAIHYSIEDKRYDDLDEKYRKRDRYAGGVISDFRDKDGYRPDVKLEYVDDSGRFLNPKEAFRQLSHRFHGKGSGKKKTEKRMKKLEELQLMKMMSSTDTPLNTLSLLQEKQKAEKSPFVVLSGNKGFTANTISKP